TVAHQLFPCVCALTPRHHRSSPTRPSSDLTFDLSFGKAHVFYPETTAEKCTVALLLDVDPIGLVRGRRGPPGADGRERARSGPRSEEHTSELQSRVDLVCRLLLEKKNRNL